MSRKFIDCREYPSQSHCSVALSADSEQELLDAAVQHAVSVHGAEDTPAFREQLRQLFKEGSPPEQWPAMARGAAPAGAAARAQP